MFVKRVQEWNGYMCRTFATSVDKISSLFSFGFNQMFRLYRCRLCVEAEDSECVGGAFVPTESGFNIPT